VAVSEHILPNVFGSEPESQLSQRGKVSRSKKMLLSRTRSLGNVNLASRQTSPQFFGRKVHQFKFCAIQDGVRQGFPDRDTSDLMNCFGSAFDVLNIQRGENVDPSLEKFKNVLVSLWVS
jgi:hypothetical protein